MSDPSTEPSTPSRSEASRAGLKVSDASTEPSTPSRSEASQGRSWLSIDSKDLRAAVLDCISKKGGAPKSSADALELIKKQVGMKISAKFDDRSRENVTKQLNEFDQLIAEVETLFQELPEYKDPKQRKAVNEVRCSIYKETGAEEYRKRLVEKETRLVQDAAMRFGEFHSTALYKSVLDNVFSKQLPLWENYRDKTIKELVSLADDIATTQHAARVTECRCHRIDQHLAEDKKMTEALLIKLHGIEEVSRESKSPKLFPARVSIWDMVIPVKEMAAGSKGKSTGGSKSNHAKEIRRMGNNLNSEKKALLNNSKEFRDRLRTMMEKKRKKDEEQVLGWHARFDASSWNTRGKRQQIPFLKAVMDDLSSDVYLMQECEFQHSSTLWGDLFNVNQFHVNVIQATSDISESRDAGMAWKAAALIGSNFRAYVYHDGDPVDLQSMQNRFAEIRYVAVNTREVILRNGKQSTRLSRHRKLSFLAFSFHGRYKVPHEAKRAQILAFFAYVMNCCIQTQLPALVGGDFNYDLSRDDIRGQLTDEFTFGGGFIRLPDNEIDYICCVSPNAIPTKLSFETIPDTVDVYHAADQSQPRIPRDDITNHWPYYARMLLHEMNA